MPPPYCDASACICFPTHTLRMPLVALHLCRIVWLVRKLEPPSETRGGGSGTTLLLVRFSVSFCRCSLAFGQRAAAQAHCPQTGLFACVRLDIVFVALFVRTLQPVLFRFLSFPWDIAGGQLGCPSPWRLGHHARPFVKKKKEKRNEIRAAQNCENLVDLEKC